MTTLVELVSLYEAYLDVMDSVYPGHGAGDIVRHLKEQVRAGCELIVSVGVSTGKSMASIYSEIDKSDGFKVVSLGSGRRFLQSH